MATAVVILLILWALLCATLFLWQRNMFCFKPSAYSIVALC